MPEDWEVVPLGSLATTITKGESPKWQGFKYQDHGALFVTSENVRDARLDLSAPKFIPMDFFHKLARSRLEVGDVLINIVGASIGRAAVWNGEVKQANINQAVAVVRVDQSRAKPHLVLEAIYSDSGQKYLGLSKVDNARPNVSLTSLRAFPMPVPPLNEQDQIVDAGRALTSRLERELEAIVQLRIAKFALMSVLLTGEVRVTPDSEAA